MRANIIQTIRAVDARYPLVAGAGSDAVHRNPQYCMAVALVGTDTGLRGSGIALTLGAGNRIVCELIELLADDLLGHEVEALMADLGALLHRLADHPELRWLGPHKGAVHLALSSIVNACFDLWAKVRGIPLWRLLLNLSPEEVAQLLDLSYLEDALTREDALAILKQHTRDRATREHILQTGYPGYDTSVGWFDYDDATVHHHARRALADGFRAFKLKVGSRNPEQDIRRARMLRDLVGPDAMLMLDANQQWSIPEAVAICRSLAAASPYWIEEPTHPDDVAGHRKISDAIAPVPIALGEHVPNRVVFKNFMQAAAVHFVQVDATRVAGVSEFLTVSLLARKFGLPVAPHVGDMGQIHQHLVLFNHIACGLPVTFLEYIPHLREHFVFPAHLEGGVYKTPMQPGASTDLFGL